MQIAHEADGIKEQRLVESRFGKPHLVDSPGGSAEKYRQSSLGGYVSVLLIDCRQALSSFRIVNQRSIKEGWMERHLASPAKSFSDGALCKNQWGRGNGGLQVHECLNLSLVFSDCDNSC
jgi:hypothetical protein